MNTLVSNTPATETHVVASCQREFSVFDVVKREASRGDACSETSDGLRAERLVGVLY